MSTSQTSPEAEDHKHFVIIINGRRVETNVSELTFKDVVELSGLPTGPDIMFTITYRRGPKENPEGSMTENGKPVTIQDEMVFNVEHTNRA
jgi:hypothetical protein